MLKVRECPLCATRGHVINSRHTDGMIRRRIECMRGHRWTTFEIRPDVSAGGKRALTARVRALVEAG